MYDVFQAVGKIPPIKLLLNSMLSGTSREDLVRANNLFENLKGPEDFETSMERSAWSISSLVKGSKHKLSFKHTLNELDEFVSVSPDLPADVRKCSPGLWCKCPSKSGKCGGGDPSSKFLTVGFEVSVQCTGQGSIALAKFRFRRLALSVSV